MRSSPVGELTRYFLDGFFRPAFLGEHGADALRRLLITLASLTAMLGVFLPYPLLKKYWHLSSLDAARPYQEALLSDQMLVLGAPMIIVGLVMTLVAPTLYVDDTDYLVLTPLPVPGATVFAAKFAAVAMFAGAFVLAANTAGNLWFPAISGGRWATHSWLARMGAHTLASLLASAFVPLAIAVLQGLTVTLLPRRFAVASSTALQVVLLCALTAAIPMLLHLPGRLVPEPSLMLVPPAWFVGVSHVLLGDRDPAFVELARIAAVAYAVVLMGVAVCYGLAYQRYRRSGEPESLPRNTDSSSRAKQNTAWHPSAACVRQTVLSGIAFIHATMLRTRLSVLVFAGVAALGLGLVVDMMLTTTVGWRYLVELPSREVTYRAIAPSLMLAMTFLVGLRAAFLLPVAPEANWIFRVIDTEPARTGLLASVELSLVIICLGVPLVIGVPIQILTLGPARTLLSTSLIILVTLTMVELVLRTWRRVPFTCSYIPGKQHLAKVMLIACFAYWLFVYRAGHLIGWAVLRPSRWLMVAGLLLAIWAALRRHRLASAVRTSFEFEDEMPDVIRSLGLSS